MVDLTIHEEDVVDQEIPNVWENPDLTADEKAKLAEVFSDKEESAPVEKPEQKKEVEEPEITADDIEQEEKPSEPARKYKIKLPEGETEVEDSELVNGYLRQQDYTRKTQELARQRAELDALREAMQYMQPELSQPPTYKPEQGEQADFATPMEKRLYEELQSLRGTVSGLQVQRENESRKQIHDKIKGAIDGFKTAHPDLTDEQITQVIKIANDEGTMASTRAFERIYKAEYLDINKEREKAVADYVKTLREKKKAAVAPSKEPGKTTEEKPDVRTMTDDQIREAMMKDLGFS